MAGVMLVGMGATGLGSMVKFVPRPVVTGFTAGIATYIFSTQIKVCGSLWPRCVPPLASSDRPPDYTTCCKGHLGVLHFLLSPYGTHLLPDSHPTAPLALQDLFGMGVPGHLPTNVPVPSEFLEKVSQSRGAM